MRKYFVAIIVAALSLVSAAFTNRVTDKEPWRQDQLMPPAELAAVIRDTNAILPVIVSVGPGGGIPESVEIGPTKEKENLEKLRSYLSKLPTDTAVVLYCGCCPFEHCPNVRPAFDLLNEMHFTNHELLDLPHNLKVDWIDKGFPVE